MTSPTSRDAAVAARLAEIRSRFEDAGVVEFLHAVIRQTWTANRARWSPRKHFDDVNTLGHQTSRNVNNRIQRTIESSDVAPTVLTQTEMGVVVLALGSDRLRVVKAPIERGLAPDLDSDFDWNVSSTREAAARRNSEAYYPLASDLWTLDLDGDPRPQGRRDVSQCRDFFLVWAAGLDADRTAAWLGMPRLGGTAWMGYTHLWTDEPDDRDHAAPAGDTDPRHQAGGDAEVDYDEDVDADADADHDLG